MGDGDVMNTFKMNVQIVNVPRQTLCTIAVSSVELHSNLIQFEIEMCRNVFFKSRLGNQTCSAVAFMIMTLFFIAGEQELVSTDFCI